MIQQTHPDECPADLMQALIETVTRDERAGLVRIGVLLETYGNDARLHFLRGSLLAAAKAYGEAREAMQKAVDIAPGYAVARFQLGLLELSSGDDGAAMATLQPLEMLPPDAALRLFASGLQRLVVDDFALAIRFLQEGMARNTENPAINRDMRLIVEQAQAKLAAQEPDGGPVSSAHLLLQQYARKAAKP